MGGVDKRETAKLRVPNPNALAAPSEDGGALREAAVLSFLFLFRFIYTERRHCTPVAANAQIESSGKSRRAHRPRNFVARE